MKILDPITELYFLQKGTKAPQAAGKIHTDFEKGFIMAEVMKFDDFKEEGSESAVKVKFILLYITYCLFKLGFRYFLINLNMIFNIIYIVEKSFLLFLLLVRGCFVIWLIFFLNCVFPG